MSVLNILNIFEAYAFQGIFLGIKSRFVFFKGFFQIFFSICFENKNFIILFTLWICINNNCIFDSWIHGILHLLHMNFSSGKFYIFWFLLIFEKKFVLQSIWLFFKKSYKFNINIRKVFGKKFKFLFKFWKKNFLNKCWKII